MLVNLPPRLRQLRDLLIETGWSNRHLAHELNLQPGTVKVYLGKIFRVAGAADRTALVANVLWGKIHGLEKENAELRAKLEQLTGEKAA